MPWTDYFVAAVAFTLGVLAASAAALNIELAYQLRTARRIESRWGRKGARLFYAALAILLFLMAAVILADWSPFRGH